MAKSRSRSNRRVSPQNANRRLPRSLSSFRPLSFKSPLVEIEDRRQFHPEQEVAPARSFNRPRHRLVLAPKTPKVNKSVHSNLSNLSQTKAHIAFEAPKNVLICVRRQIRKEVLHAKRRTGMGSKRQRPPRRNFYSDISCKG